jgi:exonuclease SbcD
LRPFEERLVSANRCLNGTSTLAPHNADYLLFFLSQHKRPLPIKLALEYVVIMKILHTSDWHIGRQFHNVSLLADQAHVLEQLIAIAAKEEVDVVVIAGDIYDRAVPPADAVLLLDKVLSRLCFELKLPVIMISGNHDSPERLGFGARQLRGAGLHIVGPLTNEFDPVVLSDEHGEVAFYGIPYVEPATVRDRFDVDVSGHDEALAFLTKQIQQHNEEHNNRRTVVVSHCFLDGGDESESERPLSVGGADRVSAQHFIPFNYTALGHLHGPQYKGAEHIRYSGSILKYSFSEERHTKSVTVVDMNAEGACVINKIPLLPLRNMRSIEGALENIIEAGKTDSAADDYVLVRLSDKQAILDVMGKLREVYPNVLHLERPGLQAASESLINSQEHLKKSETAMFSDFYQQVTGEPLSGAQDQVLEDIIGRLRRGDV